MGDRAVTHPVAASVLICGMCSYRENGIGRKKTESTTVGTSI